MDDQGFFAKIVKGELPEAPITKLLGWKFLEFDAAQQVIKVEMQARPEFINPAGLFTAGCWPPCWMRRSRPRWPQPLAPESSRRRLRSR